MTVGIQLVVYVNAGRDSFECRACGATEKIELPESVDAFIEKGRAFSEKHGACVKKCLDPEKHEKGYLLLPCDCPTQAEKACQCRRSDAWRCARDQNLIGQVACHCRCHSKEKP